MAIGDDDIHVGFGVALEFGTSSLEGSMHLRDINGIGFEKEMLDASHNGLTLIGTAPDFSAWPLMIASTLMQPIVMTGECVLALEDITTPADQPWHLAPETITIKLPKRTGDVTSGPTIAFTGQVNLMRTAFMMRSQVVWEFTITATSGGPTITAGA